MLGALFCVGTAVWIAPPQQIGPYFSEEVVQLRQAIGKRVARLPDVCVTDVESYITLVNERRTSKGGPVCAAAPRLDALVERNLDVESVTGVLDGKTLSFGLGKHSFDVELKNYRMKSWLEAIARVKPTLGRGGGGMSTGSSGGDMGVSIWSYGALSDKAETAHTAALTDALLACRDKTSGRDPTIGLSYELVLAFEKNGRVRRVETRSMDRSEKSACIERKVQAHRFTGAKPGWRAVLYLVDRPLEPKKRAPGLWNYDLESVGFVDRGPLYAEPTISRCPAGFGTFPFKLSIDALGNVDSATVEHPKAEVRACLRAALKRVKFACPEGGATRVPGAINVRE